MHWGDRCNPNTDGVAVADMLLDVDSDVLAVSADDDVDDDDGERKCSGFEHLVWIFVETSKLSCQIRIRC